MKIVYPKCTPDYYEVFPKGVKLNWEKMENGWIASRPFYDGVCDFIYCIYGNDKDGYTADADNNAFGAHRVAVRNRKCKKESVFRSLDELKKRIEDGTQLWLYERTGEITDVEY